VLEALANPMQNKYAEGYPGRRYYGGCEFVDIAERLAVERAEELFGAEHVNVQPLSGVPANMAAYAALAAPGDVLMGLALAHGGHLSHGHKVSFSSIPYDPQPPRITSEIRLGTPAVITHGMGEEEMRRIARLIDRALRNHDDANGLAQVREEACALTEGFPLYEGLG